MNTALEVCKLRLKFPGGSDLLFKDLSIDIESGETVLLLGPSGCGKSTLLQVLSGLIPDVLEVPMKHEGIQRPGSWGYVFQDPDSQFCMAYADEELAFVLENMGVPRERMEERIRHWLRVVGLQLGDPHTPIQELSQGMKQRLAIASVLAMEPEVLFLDEPTALLDPEGTLEVWQTIRAAAAGRTMIVVEHKLEHMLDLVDRIVLFDDNGRILADGPTQDVFDSRLAEIREYGIWYPGVWDDYTAGSDYQSMMEARSREDSASRNSGHPLLALEQLAGSRGDGEVKIVTGEHTVHAGEWIAVTGHNGAGKSSLLLALMQLIPTAGGYWRNGKPVGGLAELTEHMAFVFQNPEFQFVTNAVEDEMAYSLIRRGDDEQTRQVRTEEELARFGLQRVRRQHPYQLSLGQKRRLSVAASIITEPDVLLLDEPTFGQDAGHTYALLELLEERRSRGAAIIMVTHDLDIVRHFATRVWAVEAGRLQLDSTPSAYLAQFGSLNGPPELAPAAGTGTR